MVIISHYHEVACRICISLVFAVLMFGAQANTAGAESNTIPRDKNRDKEAVWAYKAVEAVGSIGSLQREPKPPVGQTKRELANLINVSKGISGQSGPDFSRSLLLYQAQCLMLLGREKEFLRVAEEAAKEGIDTPDFLILHIYVVGDGNGEKVKTRIKIWNEHGRIVPISFFGSDRDGRAAPALKIDPPPPSVPALRNIVTRLAEIGALYEKMGFERDAINSYLEALYSSPFAETGEKRGNLWLKIAELEAQQGQKALALRAYLKAAHSHKKYAKTAAKGIDSIINGPKVEQEPAAKPTLDNKTVLQIVALYRKLNLHPLALSLVVRTEKATGAKLSEEKEAIRKEWQDIVKKNVRVRGPNCHILGQKVSEVKDWAQIRVLRPSDSFWKPKVSIASKQASKIKRDSK